MGGMSGTVSALGWESGLALGTGRKKASGAIVVASDSGSHSAASGPPSGLALGTGRKKASGAIVVASDSGSHSAWAVGRGMVALRQNRERESADRSAKREWTSGLRPAVAGRPRWRRLTG